MTGGDSNISEVELWLHRHRLGHLVPLLVEQHQIDELSVLQQLTEGQIALLVPQLGPQIRLRKALEREREEFCSCPLLLLPLSSLCGGAR
eukprot:TRINITY_DN41613_c0_g1_i1.p1 TRINITY_DN41613_c0_g1~~TRINITY_DN41613_c0_g1_i1.p1  ORF type:complete len:101 (-),score=24.05 TRINITY_DN41613_c0_g1_i1:146-415(-)